MPISEYDERRGLPKGWKTASEAREEQLKKLRVPARNMPGTGAPGAPVRAQNLPSNPGSPNPLARFMTGNAGRSILQGAVRGARSGGNPFESLIRGSIGAGVGARNAAVGTFVNLLGKRPGEVSTGPTKQVNASPQKAIAAYLQQDQQPETSPEPPSAFGMTLQDYIKMFQGDSGVGAAFAAQRQQAQADFDRGNTDLGSMYAALANSIRQANADQANRQQQFQDMSKATTAAGQNALSDAFADSQAAIQQAAQNAGTADFQSQATKTGQEYQDLSQSSNQAYGNTAAQNLLLNAQAADRQGQGNLSAAQFAGVKAQADLAARLQQYLSQLGSEEAAAAAQAQQNNFGLAKDAYDRDFGAYRDYRDFLAGRDDQAWSRGMDQAQFGLAREKAAGGNQPDYGDGVPGAFQYLNAQGLPSQVRDRVWATVLKGVNNQNPGQTTIANMYKEIDNAVNTGQIPAEYADLAYSMAALLSQTKFQ